MWAGPGSTRKGLRPEDNGARERKRGRERRVNTSREQHIRGAGNARSTEFSAARMRAFSVRMISMEWFDERKAIVLRCWGASIRRRARSVSAWNCSWRLFMAPLSLSFFYLQEYQRPFRISPGRYGDSVERGAEMVRGKEIGKGCDAWYYFPRNYNLYYVFPNDSPRFVFMRNSHLASECLRCMVG